jgi:hypothetical protein
MLCVHMFSVCLHVGKWGDVSSMKCICLHIIYRHPRYIYMYMYMVFKVALSCHRLVQ